MNSRSKLFLILGNMVIIFFLLSIFPYSTELLFAEATVEMEVQDPESFGARSSEIRPIISQKNLAELKPVISKDYLAIPMSLIGKEDLAITVNQQEKIASDTSKRLLYRDGEVMVKFRKGVTETEAINRIRSVHKLSVSKRFRVLSRIRESEYLLVKEKGRKASEIADMLKKDDLVEAVSLNYSGQFSSDCLGNIPNDEYFDEQWSLCNMDSGTPDSDIDATEAWEINTGSYDIVVAVLDTGVDYSHPDLINNIWVNEIEANGIPGMDDDNNGYIDDIHGIDTGDNDSDPIDDYGHGTRVAGIIAAKGNNSIGIAGVNWNVNILPIKVARYGEFYLTDVIEGFEYIFSLIELGVPIGVTNASFVFEGRYISILEELIKELGKKDILFVAAAGNNGYIIDNGNYSPASFVLPNLITVAATNQHDNLLNSSNWGPISVDLGAPGYMILSTSSFTEFIPGTGDDIFFDNMESGSGNWFVEGDWDITTERSYSPIHAWSYSPQDNYEDNTLTSVPIDLSGASEPLSLGFLIQFELEPGDRIDIEAHIKKPSLWEITAEKGYQSPHGWSDSPWKNYPDSGLRSFESPTTDLSSADDSAELSFYLTGEIENFMDLLFVYFSKDGGENWDRQIIPQSMLPFITGKYSEWHHFSIPIVTFLDDYRTAQFRVRFTLYSNSSVNNDGYYIDLIEIKDSSSVYLPDDTELGETRWTAPSRIEWDHLGSLSGSSDSEWWLVNFPLEYCLWEEFQIRFVLSINNSINLDEVYLDNIGIGTPELIPSYSRFSGTSAAAPHVAGAVALLKAQYPNEGPYTLKRRILDGVDQLPDPDDREKVATGGRLNLYNSITQSPLTFQEQIERLLNFFDEAKEAGTLEGVGDKESKAYKNLINMRTLIEKAGKMIDKDNHEAACVQLMLAYEYCNGGEIIPSILVKGESALELSFMIKDLMINIGCDIQQTLISIEIYSMTSDNNEEMVGADSSMIQGTLTWLLQESNLVSESKFNSNSGWPEFTVSPCTQGALGFNSGASTDWWQTPLQTPMIVTPLQMPMMITSWEQIGNNGALLYQNGPIWFKNVFGASWWWEAPLGIPLSGPIWYKNYINK